jgi:hypothetical protein
MTKADILASHPYIANQERDRGRLLFRKYMKVLRVNGFSVLQVAGVNPQ